MKITSDQQAKYIQRRLEDLKNLVHFLEQNDFESIANIGHKLKGNGATFGFDAITEIGLKLESAAHRKSFDEISQLIKQLSDFLNY